MNAIFCDKFEFENQFPGWISIMVLFSKITRETLSITRRDKTVIKFIHSDATRVSPVSVRLQSNILIETKGTDRNIKRYSGNDTEIF